MTAESFERAVPDDGRATLADGSVRPAGATLASELIAAGDWRKTSLGPDADLSGVDLSGADLRGVDFTNARLLGAKFRGANLIGARFAWAKLEHADFTGAIGVVGTQFARADLAGAQMPPTVRFGAFETANEVAQGTGKLFLTVLLVCVYSWLTINSTVDAKLITDSSTSKLPILNAEIPIVNFYLLVPIALVGMAVVAMLQAQRVWSAMAAAPAVLPDATAMSDRASTWVFGAWAAARVADQRTVGWLGRVQAWLWVVVGWWIVPATVAWFWMRYLHRHDWSITFVQVIALSIACAAAAAFLALAAQTLPRHWTPAPARRTVRPYLPAIALGLLMPVILGSASRSAINGVYRADRQVLNEQVADVRPATASLARAVPAWQALVPTLLAHAGVQSIAQLAESEVSTRLTTAGALADTGETAGDPKAAGARLTGTNLRFASAERVFLALADLRSTDLLGADLWSADLRGANLGGTDFVGALLFDTDFRKVRANATPTAERVDTAAGMTYSDTLFCERTTFAAANLRYARFGGADVRGASFDHAMLQGATFKKARLQRATFVGADLDDADFRGAVGLTAAQILASRHRGALFDDPFVAELRRLAPGDSDLAHYDAAQIEHDAEAARVSGEAEPDTLSADARRQRDSVIRAAYLAGPPGPPAASAVAHWRARGGASAVPYGCTQSGTPRRIR